MKFFFMLKCCQVFGPMKQCCIGEFTHARDKVFTITVRRILITLYCQLLIRKNSYKNKSGPTPPHCYVLNWLTAWSILHWRKEFSRNTSKTRSIYNFQANQRIQQNSVIVPPRSEQRNQFTCRCIQSVSGDTKTISDLYINVIRTYLISLTNMDFLSITKCPTT